MIYARSIDFGLFAVVVSAVVSGAINLVRKILLGLAAKQSDSFDMSWELTALLKSRLLWAFEFLVFFAGFYWEFRSLSN